MVGGEAASNVESSWGNTMARLQNLVRQHFVSSMTSTSSAERSIENAMRRPEPCRRRSSDYRRWQSVFEASHREPDQPQPFLETSAADESDRGPDENHFSQQAETDSEMTFSTGENCPNADDNSLPIQNADQFINMLDTREANSSETSNDASECTASNDSGSVTLPATLKARAPAVSRAKKEHVAVPEDEETSGGGQEDISEPEKNDNSVDIPCRDNPEENLECRISMEPSGNIMTTKMESAPNDKLLSVPKAKGISVEASVEMNAAVADEASAPEAVLDLSTRRADIVVAQTGATVKTVMPGLKTNKDACSSCLKVLLIHSPSHDAKVDPDTTADAPSTYVTEKNVGNQVEQETHLAVDEAIPEGDRKPAAVPDLNMRVIADTESKISGKRKRSPETACASGSRVWKGLPRQIEFKSSPVPLSSSPANVVSRNPFLGKITDSNTSSDQTNEKLQRRLIYKTCRDKFPRPLIGDIQRTITPREKSYFCTPGKKMTFQLSILSKESAMMLGNPTLGIIGEDDTNLRDVRHVIANAVARNVGEGTLWEFFLPDSGAFVKYELEPLISLRDYIDECCFGRQLAVRLVREHGPAIVQLIRAEKSG